jgi:hypothetical protein
MMYLAYLAVPIVLVVTITMALVTDPNVRWRMRSRRPAERRGIVLLRSWLTPEQTAQWDARGDFEVVGCDTGRRYRLSRGTAMNIHELDANGCPVSQWCFAPEGKLATGDVLLAQKIALETMEQRVLALANTQVSRP